jgi:hypothetical protein
MWYYTLIKVKNILMKKRGLGFSIFQDHPAYPPTLSWYLQNWKTITKPRKGNVSGDRASLCTRLGIGSLSSLGESIPW